MFGTTLILAIRSIRRHVLRSFLTTLGIIIGVAAVIVMVAVGSGAQERIDSYIRGLGSNLLLVWPGSSNVGGVKGGRGTRPSLTEDDAYAIQNEVDSIEVSAPQVRGPAQTIFGNKNWASTVVGATPEYETAHNWPTAEGRWFTAQEALEYGFVDHVRESASDVAGGGGTAA